MQYLVLKSFRSFGVRLCKGEVVDEQQIRSPRLRMSEGKIVRAVSLAAVPAKGIAASDSAAAATLGGKSAGLHFAK